MGEVQRRFGRNSREIWERFREGFVEVQQRFILRFKKSVWGSEGFARGLVGVWVGKMTQSNARVRHF